jgi:hypothetical protein
MTLPVISQCAVEVFLASGERTKERLCELVQFYAQTRGETPEPYTDLAIAAVKPWQWAS